MQQQDVHAALRALWTMLVTARDALDGMKGRLEAATPGPWETTQAADEETTTWLESSHGDVLHHDERGYGHMRENFAWMKRADAAFIAAAPTDVARLIGAVEAIEAITNEMDETAALRAVNSDTKSYYATRIRAAVENALNPKEAQ